MSQSNITGHPLDQIAEARWQLICESCDERGTTFASAAYREASVQFRDPFCEVLKVALANVQRIFLQ